MIALWVALAAMTCAWLMALMSARNWKRAARWWQDVAERHQAAAKHWQEAWRDEVDQP